MRPPKVIDVSGSRVSLIMDRERAEMAEVRAGFNGGLGIIVVNPGLSHDQVRESTLHEVLHAVIDNSSVRGGDQTKEEDLVSALSPLLFGVMRHNPKFVAWLMETE